MNPRARIRPLAESLALSLLVVSGAGVRGTAATAGTCPTNRIAVSGTLPVVSADSALDVTGVNAHGSYDLRAGRLASDVAFGDPDWAKSSVVTDDEFRIVGLPAGTPVDLGVEFSVSGGWNVYPGVPQGDFSWSAFLSTDADTASYEFPLGGCCHGSISRVLTIPLHRVAGEAFHIRLRLASSDYRGHVAVSGVLAFSGLPPGAGIVSCQGYSAGVTAARRSSWGGLKQIHR